MTHISAEDPLTIPEAFAQSLSFQREFLFTPQVAENYLLYEIPQQPPSEPPKTPLEPVAVTATIPEMRYNPDAYLVKPGDLYDYSR
jgi:hypothetical protein